MKGYKFEPHTKSCWERDVEEVLMNALPDIPTWGQYHVITGAIHPILSYIERVVNAELSTAKWHYKHKGEWEGD